MSMRVKIVVAVVSLGAAIPLAGQAAPRLRGAVDLTIGAGDQAPGPYLFEDIRGLAFDAQGRIVVAESKVNEVRVYSPTGKFLYSVGRSGEGPGDLGGPCCITFGSDGALWVQEVNNHRYSAFTLGPAKATFLSTMRMPPSNNGFQLFDRVRWDAQGRLMDIAGLHVPNHPRSGLLRSVLDKSGKVLRVDSILPPPADSLAYFTVQLKVPGGVGTGSYYQNYGATELRAFGPNGDFATAVNSNYAVTWFDALGKKVTLVQRAGKGPPVNAKEKAASEKRDSMIEARIGQPLPFKVPALKPVLYALGFDLAGRLWVERSVAGGATHEADLYDRTGKQIAVMTWPNNVWLLSWAVRGNTGLGVETDADGVQRVVRLRWNVER